MKTSIKNIIATTLTAIVLTTSAFAAENNTQSNTATVLSEVKAFNKIKVSGNVELILVQSPVASVKVYDDYYAKNALVQEKNGELFISSFQKEKLVVVAYVNTLSALTATDNATVSSFGSLASLSLDVKLSNNATADININTINLYTNISDNSLLTLTGSASDLNANIESVAKVNMDKFSADATRFSAKNRIAKVESQSSTFENLGK